MKSLIKMSMVKTLLATASLMTAGLMMSAPANAQVHVGIGIPGVHIGVGVGAPAPAYYYGPGYYPPGPCDAYTDYYSGDCGYAVYTGPIMLDGIAVGGSHYYRWYNGQPYFWYRGGWHFWNGWSHVNFGWDRQPLYRIDADQMKRRDAPFMPHRLAQFCLRNVWNRIRSR